MRAETTLYRSVASRRRGRRYVLFRFSVGAAALALLALVFGLAYAGSPSTLARGTTIAGVEVGGLTTKQAVRKLERRAAAAAQRPVVFTAGGQRFEISAAQLGVRADWRAAAQAAARDADGFGPIRGFRRLQIRFFGDEVTPATGTSAAALEYMIDQVAAGVDREPVDARLERRGLSVALVPGEAGERLDRKRAADLIMGALGSFEPPAAAVALPVRTEPPRVTARELRRAASRARIVVSAPARLTYETTSWRLPRWRLAEFLSLPTGGGTTLALAGPKLEAFFGRLSERIRREPVDARFEVAGGTVRVVPSQTGLELDVPATVRALEAAALRPSRRTAALVVRTAQPERTTADARRMGITGVVGSYSTSYGGTPGRLHNVSLVSRLIDDTLIAPGATFSFNETTGARTPEKGFQSAPVIINGELQNGIGGGVCQVSTTVFNAAFEAGLPIAERTNHALYISHYPLGRDATVNYPDLDLKFRNDTGKWLLLRAFVGTGSLTINLYGTPQDRRVETESAPLSAVGSIPIRRVKDPTLQKGKTVVEAGGAPPRSTSVRRRVFDPEGELLYDTTWRSYYVAEPGVLRVGTKPKPKPKPKAAQGGGGLAGVLGAAAVAGQLAGAPQPGEPAPPAEPAGSAPPAEAGSATTSSPPAGGARP